MGRTTEYRTESALNGTWRFVTDPDDDGRSDGWEDPDATWPDRAEDVEVPHAWQELETYRDYAGTAWYRRQFTLDAVPAGDVLLRFDAVDYETTVWVNGERVGANRGGYLPFTVDATDAVVDGQNTVTVAVDDPEDDSEIPHGKQGEPWYHRVSGIWQDVTLAVVPSTRIDTIRATPTLEDDAVRVDVDVLGPTVDGGGELTVAIDVLQDGDRVADGDAPVDSGGRASATISLDDPTYWSPEDPSLYDIEVALEREDEGDGDVLDRDRDYFGMRSIETRDGQLHLNGEPYSVRGALDQGLYPKTLYRPFEPDLFEREVRIAKELGFNLLRKHIKPAHPDFLEAADRQGLLVWEEPANPTVHSERSKREVRDQLFGMIDRDYNRPSVVVWSLYNEEWGIGNPQGLDEETSLWEDEQKQSYLAELYAETRERDPTRLVCDNSGWAHVATDVNDYHRYFVSPDRADAWAADIDAITGSPEDNYAATETDPDAAPLLVSEFGTWGMCDLPAVEDFYGERPPWFDHEFLPEGLKRPAGYHERFERSGLPEVFEDWEEFATAWQWREYRSIKDVIEQMRTHDGVDGYVITEFSDIEWEFNGLLDYRREPKAFAEDFARINGDVLLRIDLDTHAVRAGERLEADLVVANDTTETLDGEVEWTAFDQSGTVPVTVDGFGSERIEDAITVEVPSVESVTTEDVRVSHSAAPTNEEPVTVVPPVSASEERTVYADCESLRSRLEAVGFETTSSLSADDADVDDDAAAGGDVDAALVVDPDEDVRAYAEAGGSVVLVPDESGAMVDDEFFEYRDLPETESWNLVACLFYVHDGALSPYVDTVPGWELEGLYPYDVVSDVDDTDVHVGYVEGWLANWAAAVCTRDVGSGSVTACTLRLTGAPDQPVGTAALSALLDAV